MFRLLFEMEILNQLRLNKFLISAVTAIVVSVLCMSLSTERYLYKSGEHNRAVQNQLDILDQTKNMTVARLDNSTFKTVAQIVFRKPNPLFVFCMGKDTILGDMVRVGGRTPVFAESYSQLNDITGFDIKNVLADVANKIDFGIVVKLFFSLVAVFTGFDIISSERERGTLKQVCSNSVSRMTIIMAKWAAGTTIIILTLLFAVGMAVLYLVLAQGIVPDDGQGIRILLLFCASLLYVMIFYQCSVLASSVVSSSKSSMLVMLIFWVVSIFIVPDIGSMLGKYLSPIPALDYTFQEENFISDKYKKLENEQRKSGDRASALSLRQRKAHEVWQMQKHYLDALHKQRRTVVAVSLISPAVVFDNVTELITGTSVADYERFMDRARMVNEKTANMRNEYFAQKERTFDFRKEFNIGLNELITQTSLADNRLVIDESIKSSWKYLALLMVMNVLVFLLILFSYHTKSTIV